MRFSLNVNTCTEITNSGGETEYETIAVLESSSSRTGVSVVRKPVRPSNRLKMLVTLSENCVEIAIAVCSESVTHTAKILYTVFGVRCWIKY